MQPSCECRSFTPFRGIDKDQARELRKRKRTSKRQPDVSEEERWREMYRITCGIAPQTSHAADNFFRSYQILNPVENVGASITPGLKQQYCITQTSSRPSQTDSMGHENPPIPCAYEDCGTALAPVIPHSHSDRWHNSGDVNMESQNQWPASHGQNQNYQWQVHPSDFDGYREQQTSHQR